MTRFAVIGKNRTLIGLKGTYKGISGTILGSKNRTLIGLKDGVVRFKVNGTEQVKIEP